MPTADEYSFDILTEQSCLVAVFRGDISTHRYSEFRNDYNEICRQLGQMDRKRLVIDLSETTFFGSLFIGIIMKLAVTTWNQDGHVALCGLSDQLKDLMNKLMLLERNADSASRLKQFATRDEAVSDLASIGE